MTHILVELMGQMTQLSEQEKLDIENSFPITTFDKGSHLLKEGEVARDAYLVITGCVREYKLQDGNDITTGFFTEQQSVANFISLSTKAPSKIYFECTEQTTLAVLNSEKEQTLYQKHPRFETFCRSGMEQMMGANQEVMSEYLVLKPKERYQKLQSERPDLLNRVPQYQIASYLGIKPETLSRIRKQMISKDQS